MKTNRGKTQRQMAVVDQRVVDQFNSWIKTPEARKALIASHERTQKATAFYQEARKVDPAVLHKVFTIQDQAVKEQDDGREGPSKLQERAYEEKL